ncbi:putative DNA binding domain-containing protein, partial [Dehalococcoidia bacterium]|nr:putative DNA binding domain-containing protein [Dehalococcoidia bacterium]
MSTEENGLEKLLASGETETLEFKESFDKETVETAGAFANTKGGTILIGITDINKVKGVQVGRETLGNWANRISQGTEPRVIPEIEVTEIAGKSIVIIWIKEFPIKPVSVKGKYFRRIGNSNRIMNMQEIAQMHFHSVGMSWDKLPAREQIWDYPLDALREAVINAACHRDYTIPSNTEVRIYDDKLIVWSPGGLPLGITVEELYKPHSSVLRNKGIGGIFYDMGWIEQWGSGIDKMRDACTKAGLPEPQFEEHQGFRVIFRKDIYTEEYLRDLGLNERQMKAVTYVKEKGKITNKEYQELTNISRQMATIDLSGIVGKGVFTKIGKAGRA